MAKSNYMCLTESGFQQVLCMHLTVNMNDAHLITTVYGI